ncbi:AAA family ATPase [Polaribacter porphyrae]|uniref:ATPase n=1 Tax=Polaribacter porphyrae TaxID=1137780 RepID=A0A2S7WMC4_9FLAO|nr:ATP-binding protein [Polaribacter porphyrae]PQJ78750.1 ATPase [Polaribacter porphyrae]
MKKNSQKIVLIGGPGTGKTTVLNALQNQGFHCYEEISREVTLEAQKKGIEQLFLTEPLLFSKMLLEGREKQYKESLKSKENVIFFDRGIPDVVAYLEYFKTTYTEDFIKKCEEYKYDYIFHFSPWEVIYTTDNERYETFEDSLEIDNFLLKTYRKLNYKIINVPFGKIEDRVNFILNTISHN